jgi:hypothetical protein
MTTQIIIISQIIFLITQTIIVIALMVMNNTLRKLLEQWTMPDETMPDKTPRPSDYSS